MPASSYQQQKLRVCEVCSAYLGIHDNDRRLADHFGGKLHLGFIEIREKLEELKVCIDGASSSQNVTFLILVLICENPKQMVLLFVTDWFTLTFQTIEDAPDICHH